MTEVEFVITVALHGCITVCIEDTLVSKLPFRRRQPLVGSGRKIPVMRFQLVETLIIQGGHQHCIHRLAVFGHGERPLFLLSGSQPVAEGAPLQLQFLVGQRSADLLLVGMPLAVLHPGEGAKDAVAPLLLIIQFAVDECIRLVDKALLHHLPPGEDAIGDIHILGR